MSRSVPTAFFDVDETLMSAKTMLSFRTWWDTRSGGDTTWLQELLHSPSDRMEKNRAYYRRFAGVPHGLFLAAGHEWYEDHRRGPAPFVVAGLRALRRHRAADHRIVLVSGSHRACLDPIARDLGVDDVLCTELDVDEEGVLTGEIIRPMIGEAKATAVTAVLAESGTPPELCFAYGDHSSDLPLLSMVGTPMVVGEDPVLLSHARDRGWPVLPATAGPPQGSWSLLRTG
ncbi:HAD family hydrolase [Streptomyces sp. NPDC007872]|uniref:HAD family hydrolase n=1 Tax=Streptomyces sp. NPDC007872 TaxID=3364782 RepID=UPI00367FD9AA